ncbi:MAG: hypothetical protein HY716_15070 [Planctomycetes bacterium]|nr:hypothetical protein [Planctomycetota bacterium]
MLVALVIVTTALMVVAQGFLTGGRASVRAQKATVAVLLAESKMAELETGELALGSDAGGNFGPPHPDISWEMTTQAASPPGLTHVTLTVAWEERGERRTYVLDRLMRERPADE